MKLEQRLQSSIVRRPGNVVLRDEFAGLGSPSQLTVALKALQEKGILARLGSGVYAKAVRDPKSGEFKISHSFETLAQEAFEKLGTPVEIDPNSSGAKLKVSVRGPHRLRRKLSLAGRFVAYVNADASSQIKKSKVRQERSPLGMSVARYVLNLAKRHKISYVRTYLDQWAETVTRLAGDEIQPDPIRDLIRALRRAGKITPYQMGELVIRRAAERHNVRSV